ncbi:CRISPR-associated protein Csx15 [Candidatus Leptofilum sp.]|uniref:CRISPR-associated protein Csx15 n=1 Tax=Candidatus Leptofilum sp. TaxID=3241576 RepID=UPI003B59D502
MIIINFSGHPLTRSQQTAVSQHKGQPIDQLIDLLPHFDQERPFAPQIQKAINTITLTSAEWQQQRILIVPPGHAPATAVLLAELHGRLGHFPELVRIRPSDDDAPEPYEVGEIISLQQLRDDARFKRTANKE